MDFRKEVCGLGLPQWCLVTRLPQARTGWKVVSSRASCSPGGGGIGKRGLGHMSLSSFPFCSSYRSLSLVCLNLIQIIYLVSRCLLSTTMSHYHHYCVTLLLCWVLDTNCLCLQEWDETHESGPSWWPHLLFLFSARLFSFSFKAICLHEAFLGWTCPAVTIRQILLCACCMAAPGPGLWGSRSEI